MRATSSAKNGEVVVELPKGWTELTDGQRRYVCDLLSAEAWTMDEVKALLIVRLGGARLRQWRGADGQKELAMQIAEGMALLDWMDAPPEEPLCRHCCCSDCRWQCYIFVDYEGKAVDANSERKIGY